MYSKKSDVIMSDLISLLNNELSTREYGYVQRSDEILSRIAALHDPSFIELLLPMFDDAAEHDELMFSIIHTIEAFEDATYVRSILHHLPEFLANSPRWATIIHMRILNSPPTLTAYADQLKSLTDIEKQAVRDVLLAVRRKNAKFEAQADSLLAAL